jgi:hypothetical protein
VREHRSPKAQGPVKPVEVVGRIFTVPVAPQNRPWMWASGHSAATVKRAAHCYEPTREDAMNAFSRSWHRQT